MENGPDERIRWRVAPMSRSSGGVWPRCTDPMDGGPDTRIRWTAAPTSGSGGDSRPDERRQRIHADPAAVTVDLDSDSPPPAPGGHPRPTVAGAGGSPGPGARLPLPSPPLGPLPSPAQPRAGDGMCEAAAPFRPPAEPDPHCGPPPPPAASRAPREFGHQWILGPPVDSVPCSASSHHGSPLSPDAAPFYPSGASEGHSKFHWWADDGFRDDYDDEPTPMASPTPYLDTVRRPSPRGPSPVREPVSSQAPAPGAVLAVVARSLGAPCSLVTGGSSAIPAVLLPVGRGLSVALAWAGSPETRRASP
ncbi:uncharacterized protein [Miscanthus floridulus]|uniref:uncharacterized protein n=1 Tax=Miscanthus floridulus TaxID=154761 RepID=UPI003458D92B